MITSEISLKFRSGNAHKVRCRKSPRAHAQQTSSYASGLPFHAPAMPPGGSKDHVRLSSIENQPSIYQNNGHKTDLEMSPRPLGTTVFEEIYIRTMGKQSYSSEINLRLVYSHFYDHVDHHIFQLITAFHWSYLDVCIPAAAPRNC